MGGAPTRERGRLARMLCRSVPLIFPAMGHASTLAEGTPWARQAGARPLEKQERLKGGAHPGARASRPHAVP